MREGHNTRESGAALVLVLWLVAAFAILVSVFNISVRTSANVATNGLISAQRHALLSAGVEIAAAELLSKNQDEAWRSGKTVRQFPIEDYYLRIRIQDPNGLIDLNKAHGKLLFGLLKQFTPRESEAEELRDRILDWRDEDDKRRTYGAEDFEYQRARRDRGAGDAPFTHKSQLRDVLGVSPKLYRAIAPFITTYSRNGSLNPETASEVVLKAVPGPQDKSADQTRRASEQQGRTGEAGPTTSPDQNQNEVNQDDPEPEEWLEAEMGPAYTILIELQDPKSGAVIRTNTTIVLGVDDKAPFRIVYEQPRGL